MKRQTEKTLSEQSPQADSEQWKMKKETANEEMPVEQSETESPAMAVSSADLSTGSCKNSGKDIQLRRKRQLRQIRSFGIRFVTLAFVLYLIFGVVFGVTVSPNDDMNPGIGAGDLVFYYRWKGELAAGDIVTYKAEGKTYLGRIIAKDGDEIEITEDESVKINGYLVAEPKVFFKTPQLSAEVKYPMTMDAGRYFIMCDHREGGRDSRYFGAIDEDAITGKVMTVIRRTNL
jgi:signal peptidase I